MLRALTRRLRGEAMPFACPVCGSPRYSDPRSYHPRSESSCFAGLKLVACGSCGTRSAYPMPSESRLRQYYETYSPSESRPEQLPFLDAQARARVGFFADLLNQREPLSVLDVGAGYGCIATHIAALVSKLTYEAIEWDRDSIAHLRANPLVSRVLANLNQTGRRYDLVILAHVLEHLPQPGGFMRSLRSHLHARSLVFIELPNEDYRYKDSNEPHLIFFSPSAILVLLERQGFKVLRSDTFGVPASELEAFWSTVNLRKDEMRRIDKQNSEEGKRLLRNFLDGRKRQLDRMRELVETAGPDRQWIRVVASVD